ncbi:uncharacterized protein N7459_007699 [Penicillium hispanicum]|uniref:uncharacterized protein n=1 Tax=Penicillium hispanicum TaxID=1080232 RepID=UPI00254176EE|nr:uncharacterized protein N7459_007699 [Penicillium hispanicum]KAJ5578735.1 hypothetical protein N7459_007699 [Penicillium hispanicum]
MAGEPQPAQKRRRLPFKPPSRTSAGPSTSAAPASKDKGKAKAKQPVAQSSSSASASASKPASKKTTQPKSSGKRPRDESPSALPPTPSDFASDSDSEASSASRERSPSQEPDYILAEIVTQKPKADVTLGEPKIPPKLLTRLLHHFFTNEKTRVAKDADAVVAKYIDTFVREAIARAALERAETNEATGKKGVADGFLEVEDLEKLSTQLIMDF